MVARGRRAGGGLAGPNRASASCGPGSPRCGLPCTPDRYPRSIPGRDGTRSRRLAFLLCGVGAFLAVASLGVSIGTALGLVSPATDARDLGGALLDWVAFGNPDLAVQAHLRGGLLLAVTATARVALAGGLIFALAPGEVPPSNEEGDRQAT